MEKPDAMAHAEQFAPSLAWIAASLEPFQDLIISFYAGPQGSACANEPEYLWIELEDDVQFRITNKAVIPVTNGDDSRPITLMMLWLMLRSQAPKISSFPYAAGR